MSDSGNALQERLKELRCLFSMSELVNRYEDDLDAIVKGLVELLPRSWMFPEITAVSIELEGKRYHTPGYRDTEWMQEAPVRVENAVMGKIRVCYLEKRDTLYEGPFMQEERRLLDAVAERLGRITERIRAKKQLQIEEQALRNKNIALRELMEQVRSESRETARRIQMNIDNIIMPILENLQRELENTGSEYSLRLLRQNLAEIVSPLYSKLTAEFNSLTPKELRICNLIGRGVTSKEIARIEHISPVTVNHHRENIRRKLGLQNTKTNLQRYLQAYLKQEDSGRKTFSHDQFA